MIWASACICSGIYIKALCRQKGNRSEVALTFDDGPDPNTTGRILDTLRKRHAKATFFVTGENAEKYPETVRRIVEEGHVIGNHTYRHSVRFTVSRREYVRNDLHLAGNVIYNITGRRPKLFRPPFGVTNPVISDAIRKEKLSCIGWSIRTFDTIYKSEKRICEKISGKLSGGEVILMHDRCIKDTGIIEKVIDSIERKGLSTVTVDNLFNIKAYEN